MPHTLTKPQFEVLLELLASAGGESSPLAPAAVRELEQLGYLFHGRPTPAGLEAMEPYRVKRAVFLAAGIGSRLAPITFNTPKPLVRVHACWMPALPQELWKSTSSGAIWRSSSTSCSISIP